MSGRDSLDAGVTVLHGLEAFADVPAGAAVSIGNFDGVHVGHRAIIRRLREFDPPAVVVVTFEPHPMSVLRPALAPPRLSPREMRRRLLAEAGVTHLVELAPTPQVLGVPAEAFWELVRDEIRPRQIVEGHDFRFGRGAKGTVEMLAEWARGSGVEVHVQEPVEVALPGLYIVPASSSMIRWLLVHGRVREAATCLGRPYGLEGRVVEGYRRGREIGYPTANLEVPEQLVPGDGVYAGWAEVDGSRHAAAISIGSAPTFGPSRRQVEAYLLDFDGDIYGREMVLHFAHWLREQRRYAGLEPLKAQLAADVAEVRQRLGAGMAA